MSETVPDPEDPRGPGDSGAPGGDVPTPTRPKREPDKVALAALCALAGLLQVVLVQQGIDENPLARVPINDAAAYWAWAGEIAQGRWVGTTPFLSAPLYPYVAGLVRALGGGLLALVSLQIVLHVATAILLWRIAGRLFAHEPHARWIGVLAAALWLFARDPAYYPGRVLNVSLQAFVVALLLDRMLAPSAVRPVGAAIVGVLTGVAVLVAPPLLVGVPLVAVWMFLASGRGGRGVARAATVLGAAALAIAPATIHNVLASGEPILVSAQAGVTFVHGNAPGADGTYRPIPGVSTDRIKQNLDARDLVRDETDGSWRATSRAYFARGLEYWRADVPRAVGLALTKLRWFVSGRNYGDVYVPALELEGGHASHLRFAPIRVAWLVLPALVALVLGWRGLRAWFPAALLLGVPLCVVVVFWYSPRYRFPAVPVICVLGAWAALVVVGATSVQSRGVRAALAAAFVLAFALGPIDRATGFDDLDDYRAHYHRVLGNALLQENQVDEAVAELRRAEALGDPDAPTALADALRRSGRLDEALAVLRDLAAERPRDVFAQRSLAVALAQSARTLPEGPERSARYDEALARFDAVLALDRNDWEGHLGRGNVLLAMGDPDGAIASYEAAIALRDCYANAWFNLGVAHQNAERIELALEAYERALECSPDLQPARVRLVQMLLARGSWARVIEIYSRELERDESDLGILGNLAWHLATVPDPALRDAARALELSRRVIAITGQNDGWSLDTHAAALAAAGDYAEALAAAEQALGALRAQGVSPSSLAAVEERIELYRSGRPYVQTPSGSDEP